MKEKCNFDFTKISRPSNGGNIITKPTVHVCKNGELAFYCISKKEKSYYRVAVDGSKVGIEFSKDPYDNSFSLRERGDVLRNNSKTVIRAISFDKYVGIYFHSANYSLQQLDSNIYWFDLEAPIIKYKKNK
ncbi:hypothetical protein [Lactococcus lactis]|uniref:hypothetical protein n=1 Tax=Lactococcus lactis TaxID=1358 RepID=UPI0019144A1D|nr:hypothetical protein [Lactococcus lactis]WDA67649.1 hypothetical protein IL310_08785 [Lactococcus lactis]